MVTGMRERTVVLTRPQAVRRARGLNRLTIGWNVAEAFVALAAGLAAGSVSLIGFGLDSTIEVSAAAVLAWRLRQEIRDDCTQPSDRLATRLIAVSFLGLGAYIAIQAARDLAARAEPEVSPAGIVITALSLAVMPLLARAKRRLAPVIGSRAVAAEAAQTNLCALLSAVVLSGLAANAWLGWWWADPAAGLAVAGIALVEGARTWRAEQLEDTCCA